jgi:hypothetical protein
MPVIGPIKRNEFIRYLRKLGFYGHIPAVSINSWKKVTLLWGCQILINQILVQDY